MNRIDDTLSTYRFYTTTQALYDANAFDTIEDLMDYIKSPKHYDKLYNMWSELNHPQSKDSTFKILNIELEILKTCNYKSHTLHFSIMDIYEQYFSTVGYSYYKYTGQNWYDKGIDSLVMNKTSDPYYIYELLEIEQDDYLYFPVLNKKDLAHRFITSEADYIFYFKNLTQNFTLVNHK